MAAAKKLTDRQKKQLTESVAKQIMQVCEKNNCVLRVFSTLSDDGRVISNMAISVKD